MRRVSSSCTRNRSPTGICAVCDHNSAPLEASVSCVATRISFPTRSSVPVTITSTSASAPIRLRGHRIAREPGRRMLERTTSDCEAAERRW